MNATLVAGPGRQDAGADQRGRSEGQSLRLIDRLTAQLLALGAGASSAQLSALTTTNLDALRVYLDGVAAYRRGAFQNATPLLTRAVELDSTFALALSALIEADGWHPATTDMKRIQAPRVAVPRPPEPAGPALPVPPARLHAIRSSRPGPCGSRTPSTRSR